MIQNPPELITFASEHVCNEFGQENEEVKALSGINILKRTFNISSPAPIPPPLPPVSFHLNTAPILQKKRTTPAKTLSEKTKLEKNYHDELNKRIA